MHFSLLTLGLAGLAAAKPKCTGLNAAIRAQGKEHVGSALTLRDEPLENAILESDLEIGAVTPENALKWAYTEPERGAFEWADADRHVNWAVEHGKDLRCHALVWHSQLAPWVSEGGFDNATLIQIMEDHINGVAGRYKGKCTHWDVVNEALEEDGSYRKSVFYNTIGEAYIPIAFALAAKADPHARLWYNDYNLEYNEAKTAAAARIVKLVQSYGVRIDGVGLQGHLVVEETPTQSVATPDQDTLEGALRQFTDLEVDVEYTEIDIRMNTPATPAKLEEQARQYERVLASCMSNDRCIGVTLWGISDKYSWIPYTFDGEGAALAWDDEYNKKPAYKGILRGIASA
ncbi:hypothetical protein BN1708_008179 [Verticillium longisporum]|uniref:Beta-xylanase n=1 Tax=Verticillium longisporum TaxID=100787 RepID=A0A0G4N1M4_VERLO|nr:hypothetical protein BN1708_008179 [Verticillium longisporum]